MKRLMVALAATVVLAAPATASAKEIVGLQLCGAGGCATEHAGLPPGHSGPLGGGGETAAPAKPGPWYRAVALIGDHGTTYGRFPFYYVPGARMMVQPGQGGQTTAWMLATPRWQEILDRLAARVTPFAPPTVTRVSLNGRAAQDPQSYLALYSTGGKATAYPSDARSIQIVLESARRSPWTDGNYIVLYPASGLLVRDGQLVQVPHAIAEAAAAGTSLDVGRSFPWLVVVVAVVVALVVLASMLVARRIPTRQPVPQA